MTRNQLLTVFAGLVMAIAGFALSSDSASAIAASQANVGYGKCWQNGSGNCYHWARTSQGLTLRVESDVTGGWSTYFNRAVADWTFAIDAPVTAGTELVPFSMVGQNSYKTSASCGGITGLTRVCNKAYGLNGWLGLASIWVAADGEHITAGTVKLNDSYFGSAAYDTPAWRNLVSCQELAHTLGLAHQDETFGNANLGSCMDYTNDPSTNQYPNDDDRKTLANMYAHGDSTSTVSAIGSGSAKNGAGQGLPDEDALPPNAKPSQGDVFVKRLPDGGTLITHVFWVERGSPGR
ncbi:MAG: hypothetical protein U0446_07160 [Dehalococcoidia bacterium]